MNISRYKNGIIHACISIIVAWVMNTRKCKEECILLWLQFNYCKEEIGSNMIDQSTFKHAEMGTSVHDIVRILIMCLEQCAVAVLSAHILSTHHIIPSPSFNILYVPFNYSKHFCCILIARYVYLALWHCTAREFCNGHLWTVHGKCAVCKLSDLYRSTAVMHNMHWLLSIV